MANITLKGNAINTIGNLPEVGTNAPNFTLTAVDLSHKSLVDFAGKNIILNIFPSVDTGTCAMSVREFNKNASELKNTVILCISKDLPFAQARFCAAEGLDNVVMLSDFATGSFGKEYGLEIENGPLAHLHSRVIIILDEKGSIKYTEQVSEIANEPNYLAALKAV
ncbi:MULTISPECIES: thiol peroxidase [unclassified Polaribacter]|uniref:thiol peroxidase n=1 Tax=unclassified Polaribacter TaxID=196858 RepID=UPI0011BF478E|nr:MULTISPECIES: thiol peroxidase [unclassified Polaribacter]TXD52913.1 thiol peroxidase [Polaribacter sp. IC063]TXD60859.1 thiol peroxidase [Polaribacter sp. IC066]